VRPRPAIQPITREVVVDCDPQRAFDLFTAEMTSFSVTWQVGADWQYHPDLDGFGEHAEQMKNVFESPDAWTSTLANYVAAV
jgi:hypothetical protein